jgi:hypothetical protein
MALNLFLGRAARSVGAEGAFLVIGTVLLAIGSTYLSPAGPWFVCGGITFLIGLALASPRAR